MRASYRALLGALFLWAAPAHAVEKLPVLGIEIDQTSVSGISSGAFMAGQFQVAFSSLVVGAGIVAGGPYGCAETTWWSELGLPTFGGFMNVGEATKVCMAATAGQPDGRALAEERPVMRPRFAE